MLFRRRMSFQGTLSVHRHAYHEMAAYNAPANTRHGAQSMRRSIPRGFSPSLSTVNHAHQSKSPPAHTLSPSTDCRWKRGRPVTFSGRAFGTRHVNLAPQSEGLTGEPIMPGVAKQAQEEEGSKNCSPQSPQHLEGRSDVTTALQQDTHTKRVLCTAQHNQSAFVQTNRETTSSASPGQARTRNADASNALGPLAGHHDAIPRDENYEVFDAVSNIKVASSEDSTMDDATDTEFPSSSTDESADKQDKAASEVGEANEEPSETHTPLEFQIPEDVLQAAMTAHENTRASFWNHNLYHGRDAKRLSVHYCKTKEVAERAAQHFLNEKVIGFDIEWKPWAPASSIKQNVSLIQLACEDRIALFHVALFSGMTAAQLMPPTLKAILESPDVYKVGVAVKGDFSRIAKYLKVEPQGVFELSRLNNLVQWYATDPSKVSNKLVSLAAQVQQHLLLPLYKGGPLADDPEDSPNVRSSDWSLLLNIQQIHYAAADAYAGFRLYHALEEKRQQLKPTPPQPLVCDYDSKPKPKSSKPPKKRKATTKPDGAAVAAVNEVPTQLEQEEVLEGEEAEEKTKQTQEVDGYEIAQEELIDSHQLEDDEPESSQGTCEQTGESEDDVSTCSVRPPIDKNTVIGSDLNQKRVGRINFSRVKGPDPGYPTLPNIRGEEFHMSSNADVVGLDSSEEKDLDQSSNTVGVSKGNYGSDEDEFEDSELEEALQGLNVDSDGRLREGTISDTVFEPFATSEFSVSSPECGFRTEQMQAGEGAHIERPQLLIDKEGVNVPQQLGTSELSHTPEYDLATTWAQTYLASTIPSPTSRVPSHIRATIPHLRAYNMWHHQELSLSEIARQVRNPPLSESTVGSYVLQAIQLERMEYDMEEVRKLLMAMPEALRKGKWRWLADKVGAK